MLGSGHIDWTQDGFVLTSEQKQFYEKNGYLVVPNCVSRADIDRYVERFKEICCDPSTRTGETAVMRDVTLGKAGDFKLTADNVTKIYNWQARLSFQSSQSCHLQDDPVLSGYLRNETVVNVLRDLIGTPSCQSLVAMHVMLINKPPDTGSLTSGHPMHQDLFYFPFRPADFIACAWTAMEKMSRANGCLVVVPGTHKGQLLTHGQPEWEKTNKAYHGIQKYDPNTPRTYVEMEAGDTVFFHPLLIHGSGANKTNGYRKAISCHYANGDLCNYEDIDHLYDDASKEDMLFLARDRLKKLGHSESEIKAMDIGLTDIWKARARYVAGTKSNL